MRPKPKTAVFHLRVEERLKERAIQAAARDRRSLTNFVEKVLDEYLHRNEGGMPAGRAVSLR